MTALRVNSRQEALTILGLQPSACQRRIVRAYRRLAMEHHPDRALSRGEGPQALESTRRRFAEITAAYALLEHCHRAARANRRIEACTRCGDLEELFTGLDGNAYCHSCLTHALAKRALPAPPLEVVHGGLALVGIAAALLALWAYLESRELVYWWASVLAGALAIGHLARLCVSIGYGVEPAIRSRGGWRRRFSRALRRIALAVPHRRDRLGKS
jgi:hypothetical protein